MGRCKIYELLYSSPVVSSLESAKGVISALPRVYTAILLMVVEANVYFTKSTSGRTPNLFILSPFSLHPINRPNI